MIGVARFVSLILLCGNANIAQAQASNLPARLESVRLEYQKASGLEAEFEQSTFIKSTQQNKKSNGKLWIKRPHFMRWETVNPDANLLVSNGKTFWFYTPPFEKGDRGQVMIRKSAQVQTDFLNALISGTFRFKDKDTKVVEKSNQEFELRPSPGSAGDVKLATLFLDSRLNRITRVMIVHTTGNKTEILLNKLTLTSKLDDKLFNFVPDKNTDRISE